MGVAAAHVSDFHGMGCGRIVFLLCACCAVCSGFLAAPATARLAPYPPHGRAYESLTGSLRTSIRLAPNGRRLAAYELEWRLSCSDGKPLVSGLFSPGERPTAVAADGSFAHETGREWFALRYHGHFERARFQAGFSGQFSPDRQTVSGQGHVYVRSRHRTCTSKAIPIQAFLHGRPEAPDRTDSLATGWYALDGPRTFGRSPRADVNAAIRQIDVLEFTWHIPCRDRTTLSGQQRLEALPLDRNGRFSVSFPQRGLLKDGHTVDRFKMQGTFYRDPTNGYLLKASFTITSRVVRHGRVATHCGVRGSNVLGVYQGSRS